MMENKRVNMAFTGIASFGRSEIVDLENPWHADFAVLGVPYDGGTGYKPGTRFGPRSIRDVSSRFDFFGGEGKEGFWSIIDKRHYLRGVKVVDTGDSDVLYLDMDYSFQSITNSVQKILNKKTIPVVIGGDHSITFPVMRAFQNEYPISILHLDAHLDFRDELHGVRFAHGSPLRRSCELEHVLSAAAIGLRGLRHDKSDYKDALQKGVNIMTIEELLVKQNSFIAFLNQIWSKNTKLYVSIDIDFLDPAFAPGTGTPEPGGATYCTLREILRFVSENFDVKGFDVVEVNPMVDNSQITSLLAAQIITEFIGFIWNSKKAGRDNNDTYSS